MILGHIGFQDDRHKKLDLINPYFTSPTQLKAYPVLSRSSIALFERYCQNQIFEGVHFEIQIGGPKSFALKWNHWFLVSGMSELSKNIFGYNSPHNSNNILCFFLDVSTLTMGEEGVSQALGSSEIVRRDAVRTTCNQLDGSNRLQYAGAHQITAANGLDYLSPPDACSLSAVTVECSIIVGVL